mgnify:CR=1 FL=1
MKHARQVIREAVATLLAGVGPAVYQSRVYPMVTLPVISIYANAEEAESENDTIGAPRRYTRDLTLQIDVVVDAVTGSDDLMDDYAAEIEALMAADVTLGGVVTDTNLTRTTITLDGQSDTPIAKASLNYTVWYRTTGTDPENAL